MIDAAGITSEIARRVETRRRQPKPQACNQTGRVHAGLTTRANAGQREMRMHGGQDLMHIRVDGLLRPAMGSQGVEAIAGDVETP